MPENVTLELREQLAALKRKRDATFRRNGELTTSNNDLRKQLAEAQATIEKVREVVIGRTITYETGAMALVISEVATIILAAPSSTGGV